MIKQFTRSHDRVLGFQMTGRLHDSDYAGLVPLVDAAIAAHGAVRILIQFEDFEGWDLAAFWDDFKFTASHYTQIERFAIVGEAEWEQRIVRLGKLFTGAEVKYFRSDELAAAWAWIDDDRKRVAEDAVTEANLSGLNPGLA